MNALKLLWRFSRPHTIIGSFVSVLAIYVITVKLLDAGWPGMEMPGMALLAALACNIYITGLNQVTDVGVDRINKPWLPIASGELAMGPAITIVIVSGVIALTTALLTSYFLASLIGIILLIGSAYSLPPLKFKRHHFGAAAAITIVRGSLVNLGFHAHFVNELAGSPGLYPEIVPLTVFVTGFSLGIAWFKDIPDTHGDAVHSFGTLAVLQGRRTALLLGTGVVAVSYLFIVASAIAGLLPVPAYFITVHVLVLAVFLALAARLNAGDDAKVKRFYIFFWGLFTLEYIIYPLGFFNLVP